MATDMDDFARVAGVDAKAFADAYRKGPMDALAMLMKSLSETKDVVELQEKLKELGLVGVRTSGAVLQLGQVFERVAGMSKQAGDEFTSLNALLAADAIKGDTAAAALGKLGNVMTEMRDDVGQFALPAIKQLTSELLTLKHAIDSGSDAMAGFRMVGKNLAGITGNNAGAHALVSWLFPEPANGAAPAAAPALPKRADLKNFTGPTMKELTSYTPDRMIGGAPEGWTNKDGSASKSMPGGMGGVIWDKATGADARSAGRDGRAMDLGSLAGRAMQGLGQNAAAAGGIGGILASSLKSMLPSLAESLKPIARTSASVGLSGSDFGRQQQQDILNGAAKETAKSTATAAEHLGNMLQLMQRAKGNAVNALLGPS
jgi:hypothetical protein